MYSIYCIGRALVEALVERFSRAFSRASYRASYRASCKALYRASIEPHIGVQTFVWAINRRDVYRDNRIGNRVDV